MNEHPELRVDRIEVGERSRRDLRNIESLAESIRQRGCLHPPVVRLDGERFILVAGARRLAAMRSLGWTHITVTVAQSITDELAALHAEGEENAEREPFTPSEAVAHAERIEAVIAVAAKERQVANLAQNRSADSTERPATAQVPPAQRETRTAVAKAVGMSHPKLAEARGVVAAATDEALPAEVRQVAAEAVREMDATGNVHGAHRKVEQAKAENTPGRKALDELLDTPEYDTLTVRLRMSQGILRSHRALISWDAELVAAAMDDEHMNSLIDHAQTLTKWVDRVRQARPAPAGLRLVGGN